MTENPLAIIFKEIEPDPDAQIGLLVKANKPTAMPTPPWQLVQIIRIRNFGKLNVFNTNFVYHLKDLEIAVAAIQTRTGATHSQFINYNDWKAILTGEINPALLQDKIAADLAKLQLQPVDVTDLIFSNGQFETVELTLKR